MSAQPARIYLDNAATSWPKPEAVYAAVDRYQRELGAPAGRSAYREAAEVQRLVEETRGRIARLIGAREADRVIFTLNGTDALNLALHGLLRPGDHVVTTVVEHNSVLRPLRQLETALGVGVTRVRCGADGVVALDEIRRAVQPATRLIVLNHVSNVTGAIQPAAEIGRFAKQHGLLFLVDAAQSLGHLPLHVDELHADLLAAPGHKGLLGPLGTGVLYIAPGIQQMLLPVRQGGTGTVSESDVQPDTLPDRYEAGNHNVPGIVGLGAGAQYVLQRGVADIRAHVQQLTQRLFDGLRPVRGVKLYGPQEARHCCGILSLSIDGYVPQEVAALLDAAYSVQVRSGLHCAPRMHEALGTRAIGGTVRLSLGPFNTDEQIAVAVQALDTIATSNA